MLEGVLTRAGEHPKLGQKFGRLQPHQPPTELGLGKVGDGSKDGDAHVLSAHGSDLEELALVDRQSVEPGHEHFLDGVRHHHLGS
jgi:hypothetical protein